MNYGIHTKLVSINFHEKCRVLCIDNLGNTVFIDPLVSYNLDTLYFLHTMFPFPVDFT